MMDEYSEAALYVPYIDFNDIDPRINGKGSTCGVAMVTCDDESCVGCEYDPYEFQRDKDGNIITENK